MSNLLKTIATTALCGSLLLSSTAFAGGNKMFEVTVTNVTKSEIFTPILVASTHRGFKLFKQGSPASIELEQLAEGGNTAPLSDFLISGGHALDTATSSPLVPGGSVTITVKMSEYYNHISVASMLIPTNDAFFAVNGMRGPKEKKTIVFKSPAYDAGTEVNDELCVNIPGPACGGEGYNTDRDSGEGYVYIHAGIQGNGGLTTDKYDWNNPVAIITVKQIKK